MQSASTHELAAELNRRLSRIKSLERRREEIAAQIDEIDHKLAGLSELGGVTVDGVRKRPRNDTNLADSLYALLRSRTHSVTEAAIAVREAGYMTSAENFRTIVNQTLIRDKRFRRVSRGKYTARKAAR